MTDKLTDKQRTTLQNKAMYKYFTLLGEALNDAGLDMKTVLREEIEIPWTTESVKIHLWRPIQKIMQDTDSTTEMNTSGPSEIYNTLSRHISQKFGINVNWPSRRDGG